MSKPETTPAAPAGRVEAKGGAGSGRLSMATDPNPTTRPRIDAKALWASVQERRQRWNACPQHFFPPNPDGYRVGQRVRCAKCDVEATLPEIGNYIRGFVAAGGIATDIMPDWKQP
jgi:hypothetical protein